MADAAALCPPFMCLLETRYPMPLGFYASTRPNDGLLPDHFESHKINAAHNVEQWSKNMGLIVGFSVV